MVFLSAVGVFKEKDMPNCDQYFSTIEAYDDMTIEQLQVRPLSPCSRPCNGRLLT